ncbi:MAG: DeoR/GlpR transcriptional regulator [Proteobacteria bacterium]|nr:DeoR/GlpR transcriptional regulator [Pseudomonadota bacterium]
MPKATKDPETSVKEERSDNGPTASSKSYFEIQDERRSKAKKLVAEYIIKQFLHEGDSILLDAGTSLYPLAEGIVQMAENTPEQTHFTIMTHNYRAFEILVKAPRKANLNIILAGGRYDQDLVALFGVQTTSNYATFFPRAVVIGISGFVADIGLFCHGNTEEIQLKEDIFSKACLRRIIVADHSKLGVMDSFRFGKATEMRAGAEECIVVTDKPRKSAEKRIRDRYHDQIEKLRDLYQVDVREIDVPST